MRRKRSVVIWRWQFGQWRRRDDCHELEFISGVIGWFVMLAFLDDPHKAGHRSA